MLGRRSCHGRACPSIEQTPKRSDEEGSVDPGTDRAPHRRSPMTHRGASVRLDALFRRSTPRASASALRRRRFATSQTENWTVTRQVKPECYASVGVGQGRLPKSCSNFLYVFKAARN